MDYSPYLDTVSDDARRVARCFAFSVHKCGSSMLFGMIGAVCKHENIAALSIPDALFNHGIFERDWSNDPDLLPYLERDFLFYGFRELPAIMADGNYKLLDRPFFLLVRDPRDALVSQYYSFGKKTGSHIRPKKNAEAFEERLSANDEMDIDNYVLQEAGKLKRKLDIYRSSLNFAEGRVWKYENAFFDKEGLLVDCFSHLGIDVPKRVLNAVAKRFDIRPEKEDETKHIRKGTPGDHATKLRPATIAQLNETFRETSAFFGYDL